MGFKRLIQSGNNVELYSYDLEYEQLPFGRDDTKRTGRSVEASAEDKVMNRLRSLSQAKKKIRRAIYSNCTENDVFLTLTFKELVTDLDRAHYEFKKFRQRLEYRIGKKLKYVCIIEWQERGAIHYHVYLFDIGFIDWKVYQSAWGLGFIRVNKINDPGGVGHYVSAYMTKDLLDREELTGRKAFFISKGLEKPKVWDSDQHEPVIEWIMGCTSVKPAIEIYNEFMGNYTLNIGRLEWV